MITRRLKRWLTRVLPQAQHRRPGVAVRRALRLELLEDRILPSTINWSNPSGGNWDIPANWQGGNLPGAGDVAVINTAAAATITIQTGDNIQVQAVTTAASATLAITGGSLTVTAGASTLSGPLAMTGGALAASGAGVSLTGNGSTTVSDANLYATSGATLNLPQMTSYTGDPKGSDTTLQASGASSVLDLPNLTTFTGGHDQYGGGIATISAQNGGQVNLPALTTDGGGFIAVQATTGGSVQINQLASLSTASLTVDATSTVAAANLASFTSSTLTVTGGTPSFPKLADVDVSNISVNSTTLSLPAVTSYKGDPKGGNTTLQASGASSVLDLPNLTTFTGGHDQYGGGIATISAQNGGQVRLTALTTNGGGLISLMFGNGGELDLGATVVSVPSPGSGSTVNLPQLPKGFQQLPINVTNTQAYTGGTTFNVAAGDAVYLAAGKYSGGVTFSVPQGAVVDLTGNQTSSYSGTLTGSGGGTVQLTGGRLAIGVGGLTLDFAGAMLQWTAGALDSSLGDATNLGTINLTTPGPTFSGDGTFDNFGMILQGGSGNFSLISNRVAPVTLKIEPGGLYVLEADGGVSSQNNTLIDNAGTIRKAAGQGTSTLAVNGPFTNTGTIEADSGTLALAPASFSQLSGATLTGGSWQALNGATLSFPASTALTTSAANLVLGGAGATINGIGGLASNNGSFTLTGAAASTTAGDLTNSGSLTVGPASTLTVSGNFTQTSAGTLTSQFGGTPTSGQFGPIAVKGSVTLAGGFATALVNGFGPGSGQDFRVLTFTSASGNFARFAGLNPFFTEVLNPASLDLVDASTNAVNLVASNVTAPTTATAGQQITVNWQVNDPGSQAATGSWQDSVYLSPTSSITAGSILLGATPHSGGLAAGGMYNGSWTGTVPSVPPGTYYVLVEADSLYQVPVADRAGTILSASTGQLTVSLPVLTMGTPLNDSFTAADQNHYYQVSVPAGGSVTVSLTSAATTGATALYVSAGTEPTPYAYQYTANLANQPNQTLTGKASSNPLGARSLRCLAQEPA